jgi:hypothetical protein
VARPPKQAATSHDDDDRQHDCRHPPGRGDVEVVQDAGARAPGDQVMESIAQATKNASSARGRAERVSLLTVMMSGRPA